MTITGQIVNLTYYFKTGSDLWLPAFGAHQLTQTITVCKLFNSFMTNSTCFMVCLNKSLHNDLKIIPFIKEEITKFSIKIHIKSE